jgi:hypothetical protein
VPEPSSSVGGALTTSSSPSDEELIQALHAWTFRDEGAPYARNMKTGESVFLDPFVHQLLEGVRSFGPASEHVDRFLQPFKGMDRVRLWRAALRHQIGSGGRVRLGGLLQLAGEDALRSLQLSGILQSRSSFVEDLRAAVGTPPNPPPIRTMGIPTANRPEILLRALDSYLPHFKACVVDS